MIESIKLVRGNDQLDCRYFKSHEHKVEIDSSILDDKPVSIKITFLEDIVSFRNFDYKWVKIKGNHKANWYSPKIIKLKNDYFVQSSHQVGIWEVEKSNRKVLFWHFNHKYSKPLTIYDQNNSKRIIEGISKSLLKPKLNLLFSKKYGIEFSRSKIPFSAIVCFTDHCDFDSLDNLEDQRLFFKNNDIKITKGFFLKDFSNQKTTACFENNKDELQKWIDDGHELAYHSLSKSIKPLVDGLNDFKCFNPPLENIITYIDHGFQPYNVSLYENYDEINSNYGVLLKGRGITNFWNYVDTGTAVKGVINQINPNQFTLDRFSKGIKHFSLKVRMRMLLKNIVFHYFNDDASLRLYRSLAIYFKSRKRKKKLKRHFQMFKKLMKLSRQILPIIIFWNKRKKKTYPLAEFSPLIFSHDISGEPFFVFQTLEMIDFKLGLCQSNVDLLINESGLFIAHTYFSAPLNYHQGKLFGDIGKVDALVAANFKYLSSKIKSKELWNPTLRELIRYLNGIKSVVFDCNELGIIKVENQNDIAIREIK